MKTEIAKDLIELVNGMKDFVKSKSVKYGATTFDYIPLDDILDKASGFSKWAIMQPLSNNDAGVPCVETILIHESGEQLSSGKLTLINNGTKMQEFGSVITYTRRYQLGAFLGINTEIDNDGTDQKPTEVLATSKQVEILTQHYVGDNLTKLLEANHLKKIEDMPMKKASELIGKIMAKKGETK